MAKRTSSRNPESKPRRVAKAATHRKRGKEPRPAAAPRSGEIELIARGIWICGSHVLLCRNTEKGYHYLPGGHIEFCESASGALEREFLEESGLRMRTGNLAMVCEGHFQTKKRWHHELNMVFHVEPAGIAIKSDRKTGLPRVASKEKGIDFRWVDAAAIVDLDVRPEPIKAFLAAGAIHPVHPAGVVWASAEPA